MRSYSGAVPGASVLVVRDGKILLRKSYGMANLEEHIAATPQTNYRLALVTKQFTAAAIFMLAERGKLSLDDPITKWLVIPSRPFDSASLRSASLRAGSDGEEPPMRGGSLAEPVLSEREVRVEGLGTTPPSYMQAITIRHLLTHTSGLLAYEDLIPAGTTKQLKDADVLRLLAQQTTTYFAPGTHYRYSNTGYAFLALIVERVSGVSFGDFLRENIFKLAAMNATVAFEEGISTVAHRAYGYSPHPALSPQAGRGWREAPGEGLGWHRTDQ